VCPSLGDQRSPQLPILCIRILEFKWRQMVSFRTHFSLEQVVIGIFVGVLVTVGCFLYVLHHHRKCRKVHSTPLNYKSNYGKGRSGHFRGKGGDLRTSSPDPIRKLNSKTRQATRNLSDYSFSYLISSELRKTNIFLALPQQSFVAPQWPIQKIGRAHV
jgi:hypothetical protein